MSKKVLTGKVVSAKMKNTLVVAVENIFTHPKYKKIYKRHKKYKAHYENGEYFAGDTVVIEECRPISKDKNWKVIKKLSDGVREVLDQVEEVKD